MTKLATTILAAALAAGFATGDTKVDKPATVLKDSIKKTEKVKSYSMVTRASASVVLDRGDHSIDTGMSFAFQSRTSGKVTEITDPVLAFRAKGAREGAIFQDGAWRALSGWDAGWEIIKIQRDKEALLDEISALSKKAELRDGVYTLVGTRELALAHIDNVTNTNRRSGIPADPKYWEPLSRTQRQKAEIVIAVSVDDEGLVSKIEIKSRIALRLDRPSSSSDPFAGEHLLVHEVFEMTDWDSIPKIEAPKAAAAFVR